MAPEMNINGSEHKHGSEHINDSSVASMALTINCWDQFETFAI